MRYWDSSALIPLIVEEARSGTVRSLLKEDTAVTTWWGTAVECFSALCRLKREALLKEEDFYRAKARADQLMAAIDIVTASRPLKERALRLLALHPLRAGDSLQLASALRWCQDQTSGVVFVCLDDKLRTAATVEGFSVVPVGK